MTWGRLECLVPGEHVWNPAKALKRCEFRKRHSWSVLEIWKFGSMSNFSVNKSKQIVAFLQRLSVRWSAAATDEEEEPVSGPSKSGSGGGRVDHHHGGFNNSWALKTSSHWWDKETWHRVSGHRQLPSTEEPLCLTLAPPTYTPRFSWWVSLIFLNCSGKDWKHPVRRSVFI